MLIRSKDSEKTTQLNRLNAHGTTESKQQFAESSDLQKDVQGAVSDIVRTEESEGNFDPTAKIASYLDNLGNEAPKNPDRNRPLTADRYVTINGRLTLVKRGRR